MLGTWIALVAPPAVAETLAVDLKERTSTLYVPRETEVAVSFRAGPDDKPVEATWDSSDSSGFAVVCGAKGEPPPDDIVEKVMLQVGDDKWALAPGSNVRFTCPAGVTVTAQGGAEVGTLPSPVTMTITKVKARSER